jgi:hypothetical protein
MMRVSQLRWVAWRCRAAVVRGRTVGLVLGACVFGGAFVAVPQALAGTVVLWACHGPAGQGLGSAPFSSVASGDGLASAGAGCNGSVVPSSDDGLSATFSRPDPAGGSTASWALTVPAGVTLNDVIAQRSTTGFGGAVQPGDPQAYSVWTPAGVLESSTLAAAPDAALTGSLSAPASGTQVELGVSCGLYAGYRCAAPAGGGTVGVDFSSVALNVTDSSVPEGAVGGVQSVAAGSLNLVVDATDSGLGLESLNASLDGETVASAQLGGASCADLSTGSEIDLPLDAACPPEVVGVPLTVNVANVPDGRHQLTVTVTDAAGTTTALVNQEIEVLNHPPSTTPSVTVSVGTIGGSGGSSSSAGSSASTQNACADAQLSVRLSDRPLRVAHGHLVLRRGKRYLYRGRLTCVVNGQRTGAPRNTVVDLSFKLRHHTRNHFGTTTNAKGQIWVVVACASKRTIVFTYTSPTGVVTKTSLRVVTRR